MAYVIREDYLREIVATFSSDQLSQVTPSSTEDTVDLKKLFKEHKHLTIKQLKRQWDVCSLESYVENAIIPKGLRERIIPAEHLKTERFMVKWKQECLDHGLKVLQLIIEEEKLQLSELNEQIKASVEVLDIHRDDVNFETLNDQIKKEAEKVQRFVRSMKQKKFLRDKREFEEGAPFDRIFQRQRSRSRRNRRVNFREVSSDLSGWDTEASEGEGTGQGTTRRNSQSFLDERENRERQEDGENERGTVGSRVKNKRGQRRKQD